MTIYIDWDSGSAVAWKTTGLSSEGVKPVSISSASKLFYSEDGKLCLIFNNCILIEEKDLIFHILNQ